MDKCEVCEHMRGWHLVANVPDPIRCHNPGCKCEKYEGVLK